MLTADIPKFVHYFDVHSDVEIRQSLIFLVTPLLVLLLFAREKDDVLPGDHKIYADELPRELKKGRVSSAGGGSGGRQGSAWSGFGGSNSSSSGTGGGAGGKSKGAPAGRTGVIAGGRRLSVTKQEALRSKGVFKIAPPSKVWMVAIINNAWKRLVFTSMVFCR